jgi:hypothetical protein
VTIESGSTPRNTHVHAPSGSIPSLRYHHARFKHLSLRSAKLAIDSAPIPSRYSGLLPGLNFQSRIVRPVSSSAYHVRKSATSVPPAYPTPDHSPTGQQAYLSNKAAYREGAYSRPLNRVTTRHSKICRIKLSASTRCRPFPLDNSMSRRATKLLVEYWSLLLRSKTNQWHTTRIPGSMLTVRPTPGDSGVHNQAFVSNRAAIEKVDLPLSLMMGLR